MIYLTKNQNQKKSTIDVFKSGKNVSANWIIFRRIIITLKRHPAEGVQFYCATLSSNLLLQYFSIFFWICVPGSYFVELESYVVRLIN